MPATSGSSPLAATVVIVAALLEVAVSSRIAVTVPIAVAVAVGVSSLTTMLIVPAGTAGSPSTSTTV